MREFLIALMECSVTMSALVLLFVALTPKLSKRYAAKWLYYGWLVIVIGLIIPFRLHPSTPLIQGNFSTVSVQQMASDNSGIEEQDQSQTGTQNNMAVDPATDSDNPESGIMELIQHSPWYLWAGVLWILGAVVFIAIHGIRHRRFLQMVRRWSKEVTNQQILSILQGQKAGLGISKRVALRTCPCVSSPMMIGMIKPVILLPSETYSESELSLLFRHELVHFKRNDLWYKVLVFIATAIHWFNPIIYLMAKAIAVQCEISCDMEVVKNTEIDKRQQYSETILGAAKCKTRMQTAFSTNFYGGKKEMKNRVFSIMDKTKKKTGILILCAALILTLGSGAVFAAGKDNTENADSYTVEVYNDTTIINLINEPFIQDGELYLPLRETLNAFGIDDIEFNNGDIQINMPMPALVSDHYYENSVWATPADTCEIAISNRGLKFPTQNIQTYNLRTAPILVNDTTYVPVDFFEGLIYQGQIPRFKVKLIQPTDPGAYYSADEEVFIGTAEQQDSYNPVDGNGNRILVKRIITDENGEVLAIVTVENQRPEVLSEMQETIVPKQVAIDYKGEYSDSEYGYSSAFEINAYGEYCEQSYGIFITKNGETVAYIPYAYQINKPAAVLPES